MRGCITRRGKRSWRLKFDTGTDLLTGRRTTTYVTVRGKRADAQRELTRLLSQADTGTLVEPRKTTPSPSVCAVGLTARTGSRQRPSSGTASWPSSRSSPTLVASLRSAYGPRLCASGMSCC